jgi:hypothetical protein
MLKHHLIRRALTGGLVIVTVGLPTSAQANGSAEGGGPSPPSVSTTVPWPVNSYSSRALHPHGSTSAAPMILRVSSPSGGFDWRDAGMGAAGAVILIGAAAAGIGMTRRRRTQRALLD